MLHAISVHGRLAICLSLLASVRRYTRSDPEDHVEAASLIGNAIELAVRSVSQTAVEQKGPAGGVQQALSNQELVAGVRFELTTFGL